MRREQIHTCAASNSLLEYISLGLINIAKLFDTLYLKWILQLFFIISTIVCWRIAW